MVDSRIKFVSFYMLLVLSAVEAGQNRVLVRHERTGSIEPTAVLQGTGPGETGERVNFRQAAIDNQAAVDISNRGGEQQERSQLKTPMDQFVDTVQSWCKNTKLGYASGTQDGTRDAPSYPYLSATCPNRRQHLVARVMESEKVDILIEVGAYLSAVARIKSEWKRPKYHIIVDPSAPACKVTNTLESGGTVILEVPALLGSFWEGDSIQQGLKALVQQHDMKMGLVWLGFCGTPFPSLGSPEYSRNANADQYGVLDVASAEAMRMISFMSDMVIIEAPGSHCSPQKSERCPKAACGPEFMSYDFGCKFEEAPLYAKLVDEQNTLEASYSSTSGYKNKWSTVEDCLLRNTSFPCMVLPCHGDLPPGQEPVHIYGKPQVTRELFVLRPKSPCHLLSPRRAGAVDEESLLFRDGGRGLTTAGEHTRLHSHAGLPQVPECTDAIHVQPPSNEKLQDQTVDQTGRNQVADYQKMAEASEIMYTDRGLRAEADPRQFEFGTKVDYAHHPEGLQQEVKCALAPELDQLMNDKTTDRTWSQGYEKVLQEAVTLADARSGDLSREAVCSRLAAGSLAWKLASNYIGSEQKIPITSIVRKYHDTMKDWIDVTGQDQPSCYKFPKPKEILCHGGLSQHDIGLTSKLEPLYPGGRNLWYHESHVTIDLTAYRPLPSVQGFDMARIANHKKVLLVVGANGFYRATKYLIDAYSPYMAFDEVFMFEPDAGGMKVPADYNRTGNIKWKHGFVRVGTRDDTDLLKFMADKYTEKDFVVVMFDVDAVMSGPTIEWGLLADLVSQDQRLVDELYIELHMYKPDLGWHHDRHSSWEQFDILHQLRYNCGAAIHAWP